MKVLPAPQNGPGPIAELRANTIGSIVLLALISGIFLGCSQNDSPSEAAERGTHDAPVNADATTDGWIGEWKGPEGTYLQISSGNGAYAITIKDLDHARTFSGSIVDDHIEFKRDGREESITASNGDDTGMKWLAGKNDCLKIRAGEGYCRD